MWTRVKLERKVTKINEKKTLPANALCSNIERYAPCRRSVHLRIPPHEIRNHGIISECNDHLFLTTLDSSNICEEREKESGADRLFHRLTPVVREEHPICRSNEIIDRNPIPTRWGWGGEMIEILSLLLPVHFPEYHLGRANYRSERKIELRSSAYIRWYFSVSNCSMVRENV